MRTGQCANISTWRGLSHVLSTTVRFRVRQTDPPSLWWTCSKSGRADLTRNIQYTALMETKCACVHHRGLPMFRNSAAFWHTVNWKQRKDNIVNVIFVNVIDFWKYVPISEFDVRNTQHQDNKLSQGRLKTEKCSKNSIIIGYERGILEWLSLEFFTGPKMCAWPQKDLEPNRTCLVFKSWDQAHAEPRKC